MTATRFPPLLTVLLMQAVAEKTLVPLLDFNAPAAATKWQAVNDGVMGALPTTKDEWTEVEIPLADLIPTAFGRRVQGVGPVEPDPIKGLGFMLSDKQPGKFSMQVEWVQVVRKEK